MALRPGRPLPGAARATATCPVDDAHQARLARAWQRTRDRLSWGYRSTWWFWNSIQSFCIYSLGFSLVVSQHVAALLSSQAGVNDANKTSHQSIFYPHHCICKTTINYKASQKSSENPSTFWHLHCAPSLERTGQHDVCHSLYLYPAVYLKRCGQTVENRSSFILRITYPQSSVTPPLAGPSGRRPPGMWRSPEPFPGSGGPPGLRATHAAWRRWWQPHEARLDHPGDVHFGLLKPISFIPWLWNGQVWPKGPYPNQTKKKKRSKITVGQRTQTDLFFYLAP